MGQSDSVSPQSAGLAAQPDQLQPVDSSTIPRFAGPATFMRLPVIADPSAVDIAMFGIPWDGGTTNRPGARHGPRQVREMSGMIRRVHGVTRVSPYDLCRVADLGDAPANPVDLQRSMQTVQAFVAWIVAAGAIKACESSKSRRWTI
jgi:guanidinopropionase